MATSSLIRKAVVGGKSLQHTKFSTVAGKFKIKSMGEDFPFRMEDIPGKDRILLKRDFVGGERITLEVYGPHHPKDTFVGLFARISKPNNGSKLTISSGVDYDGVHVHQVYFKAQDKHHTDEMTMLFDDGEKFWREYLRVRGLEDSMGAFLFEYMTKRRHREHLFFLNKLNEFAIST